MEGYLLGDTLQYVVKAFRSETQRLRDTVITFSHLLIIRRILIGNHGEEFEGGLARESCSPVGV